MSDPINDPIYDVPPRRGNAEEPREDEKIVPGTRQDPGNNKVESPGDEPESDYDVPPPRRREQQSENNEPSSGNGQHSSQDSLPRCYQHDGNGNYETPADTFKEPINVVPNSAGIAGESENDVPKKTGNVGAPVYGEARLYSNTNKAPEYRRVIWKPTVTNAKDLSAEHEVTPARHTCIGSTKDPYAKPDPSKHADRDAQVHEKDPLDRTYVDMTELREAIDRGAGEDASSVPPLEPNQPQADGDNSKHDIVSEETCQLQRHTCLGDSGDYIDMSPVLFKEKHEHDQLDATNQNMKQLQDVAKRGESATLPPLPPRPRPVVNTRATIAGVNKIPPLPPRPRSPCPRRDVDTRDTVADVITNPSLPPRPRSPWPRTDVNTSSKFDDASTIKPLPTPRSRSPRPRSGEDNTVGDVRTIPRPPNPRSSESKTVEIVYDRPDGVGRIITSSTSTGNDSDEDDRGDPTAVDEGIFEDPTPTEHLEKEGSVPQRSNSDEFDDDHSVFIEAETRRRDSDTTPPTSQMTSTDGEMTEQLLKDKPGAQNRGNAHSGGSGYYSAEELDRKHAGRKDCERDNLASDYLDEDPCHLTIRGLPTNSTRESLESHIKQFGVDLDKVKSIRMNKFEKEAVMEFHDSEGKDSALATLSGESVVFEGNALQVSDTIPNTDPSKLFVSGLSHNAAKQCLSDALMEAGISPADIQVGITPGTALVTFSCPSDFRTFQSEYHKQAFDGRVISSYPVEMAKTIKIRKNTKVDLATGRLKVYLERFNGKSRAVDNVVWNEDMRSYIAMFRNVEDVLDVCSTTEHEVDGCTVNMSPYYPCLELESSVFTLPKPVELQGRLKYLAGFWNCSRIYKDKFQEILLQNNGVLYHHKDGRLLVLCSIDILMPRAHQRIAGWSQRFMHAIQTFSDSFSVLENINVASECWDKVFDEISQTFADDTGSVSMMDLQQQDGHLVVAGEKARVSEILETIQKREEEIQTLTKKKLLKTFELELLLMVDPRAWKPLKPTFLKSERCISFEGPRHLVEEAMTSLYEKLQSLTHRLITGYGKMTEALLNSPTASEYIKQKLKIKQCTFDVKESVVHIYTMKGDLDKAAKDLVSCIRMKRHKLRANDVMNSTEWQMKLNELYHRRDGLFQLELTANEMKLVCVDDCFEEIYNDTLMFLDSLTEINSFYDIDLGKWRFIESYKRDELLIIQKLCKRLKVDMIESDVPQRKGFVIRGRKCDCQEVLTELRKVTEMPFHQDCKLAYPTLREFVRSEECIQELFAVELDTKCGMHFDKIRTPAHQPEDIASRTVGQHQIVITEGDVTDMIVDIIVIPSDNCLQNMSSFGAAIVNKVGYEHQLKCDELVRNKGELEYGQIFLTSAGKSLPSCKAIINVAVPVWMGGGYDEEQLLKLAIQNCLMATTEENCKTIIFPSLDCTLNYPIEIATRVMVEAITDYIHAIEGVWTIEKVYICAVSKEARNYLEAEFLKNGPTDFGSSLSDNDIKVHVVQGELAKQEVGVLVNSGNKDLNLKIGALSRSLLNEGGEQLQKQCHNLYPDGIRTGEVAVTDAAAMENCKYVFHGVLENWDGGKGRAEQIMGVFVEKCLSLASEFFQTSIAFPAIGTGSLGFRPDFVAELFMDCVYTYKCQNPDTTLKEVYLVVWPGDKETLEGFQEVQARVRQSGGRPQGRFRVFSPQFFSQSSKFIKSYGDLSVEIVQGDITSEKTEAIVNSVSSLNLNTGNVSKAIFSRTGPSVQTEINSPENKRAMQEHVLVVTGSGYLDFCRTIIHLEVRHGKNGWIESILKCLETADNMEIHSLSFPAIGTGGGGFQAQEMASAMFTAIRKFSESDGYKRALRRIRIVIFDAKMMVPFISEANSEPKRRSFFAPKGQTSTARTDRDATVHLYGESPEHLREAESKLQNLFTKETICIGKMMARHFETGEDREAILKIGQNHKVQVEITKEGIIIEGWRSYVAAAKKDIDDVCNGSHVYADVAIK